MSSISALIPASPTLLLPLRSNLPFRTNLTERVSIEGQNICFSIKTRQGNILPILRDCSLRIPSGQFWMLLGPNGCGKVYALEDIGWSFESNKRNRVCQETKMFCLPKSRPPDFYSMNVYWDSLSISQVVMPTVEADVAFGLGKFNLTQDEVKSRVLEALNAVGMSSYLQRSVQTLSGGQKQRVGIAGALAESCKVLLLDELTTFLDENDQIGVVKAVRNCLDSSGQVTALWVTHRLEELEYADGAVYMEEGKVVKCGSAATISGFIKARQSAYAKQVNAP